MVKQKSGSSNFTLHASIFQFPACNFTGLQSFSVVTISMVRDFFDYLSVILLILRNWKMANERPN